MMLLANAPNAEEVFTLALMVSAMLNARDYALFLTVLSMMMLVTALNALEDST